MNANLACGTCGCRLVELSSACATCDQTPEQVRAEVQTTVARLLRLHGLLAESRHIYANYQRTLVEQELACYGVKPSANGPKPV